MEIQDLDIQLSLHVSLCMVYCSLQLKHLGAVRPIVQLAGNKLVCITCIKFMDDDDDDDDDVRMLSPGM